MIYSMELHEHVYFEIWNCSSTSTRFIVYYIIIIIFYDYYYIILLLYMFLSLQDLLTSSVWISITVETLLTTQKRMITGILTGSLTSGMTRRQEVVAMSQAGLGKFYNSPRPSLARCFGCSIVIAKSYWQCIICLYVFKMGFIYICSIYCIGTAKQQTSVI